MAVPSREVGARYCAPVLTKEGSFLARGSKADTRKCSANATQTLLQLKVTRSQNRTEQNRTEQNRTEQGLLPVIGLDIPKADTRKCTANATETWLQLRVPSLAS